MASSEASRRRRRRPRRSVAAGTVLAATAAAAAAALWISAGEASSSSASFSSPSPSSSSPAASAAFSSAFASFSPASRRLARRRADCGIVRVSSDPLATGSGRCRGVRPLLAADGDGGGDSEKSSSSRRERIRSKVKSFAKSLVSPKGGGGGGSPGGSSASDKLPLPSPSPSSVLPSPRAVAEIIQDGALGTVEEVLTPAVEAGRQAAAARGINLPAPPRLPAAFFPPGDATKVEAVERAVSAEGSAAAAIDAVALAKTTASDAFASAEDAIAEAERALGGARRALAEAKTEAAEAIGKAEEAAVKASESASRATRLATEAAKEATDGAGEAAAAAAAATKVPVKEAGADAEATGTTTEEGVAVDVSEMGYDDVDYHLSEMAPPFIGEDQCLVPGEAVVRVEKAPDNSRRIFAGIDIMASVDDVWKVLTAYDKLQEVVPNLVVNDVVELYERDATAPSNAYDPSKPDELQCREISTHMRGAKLRQVGGAKVVGINFSARTTLEVREWPEGMPDFAHYSDEMYDGQSRDARARAAKKLKLRRYRFPRPFALSTLPTRDISMQSVEDDDGEFRLYQGVWRMQPLPGCAPEGEHAMRLTYAVEISPRPYLPVALVEGRIAQDLCTNLRAIRDHVSR